MNELTGNKIEMECACTYFWCAIFSDFIFLFRNDGDFVQL
jgi:hypothetical protein